MKRQSSNRSSYKVVFYAVVLAVIVGIGIVVMQDINVPTEHVSQPISVTLEK